MFDARYLIVGQGLAGTVLADVLLERGATLHIADLHLPGAASRAAAGIWNPLTARTLQEAWRFSEFMPQALRYYTRKCQQHHIKPPRSLPLLRPLPNRHSQEHWNRTAETPGSSCLKSDARPVEEWRNRLHIGAHYGWVNHAGHLDVAEFIAAARAGYIRDGILRECHFDTASVEWMDSGLGLKWKGKTYEYLILARGHQESTEAWFGWLPFNLAQGELLLVTNEALQLPFILQSGGFLLPTDTHQYLLGATYEWEERSPEPTEKGMQQLHKIMEGLTPLRLQVENALAGIRPTVADRRPLLGEHPANPRLLVFNGLGTKGVSMAPALAQMLADHLQRGAELPAEVDIRRFFGRYRRSTGGT